MGLHFLKPSSRLFCPMTSLIAENLTRLHARNGYMIYTSTLSRLLRCTPNRHFLLYFNVRYWFIKYGLQILSSFTRIADEAKRDKLFFRSERSACSLSTSNYVVFARNEDLLMTSVLHFDYNLLIITYTTCISSHIIKGSINSDTAELQSFHLHSDETLQLTLAQWATKVLQGVK